MDGFLNIVKPPGMSSHDVVAYCRRVLNQKKIGHTGTLDPGAAGVLVLAVGRATRLSEYVLAYQKRYRCRLSLGEATDSGDAYGKVIQPRQPVAISAGQVEQVLGMFRGPIQQLPPMTSAVKVGGKKLYQLARQGKTVAREKRAVTVYSLQLLAAALDGDDPYLLLDVVCSKGTYIRSLCHDIGAELGCGGYMSFLLRTGVGPFLLRDACTLEELPARIEAPEEVLLPLESGITLLPKIKLECRSQLDMLINGRTVSITNTQNLPDGVTEVAVYEPAGTFAAIGLLQCISTGATLRPRKVLFR